MQEIHKSQLSEAAMLLAAERLSEDDNKREDGIKKILEWLQTQPHLNARTDTVNIVRFLRGCKYDFEKTCRKMTNYYMIRTKAPEWYNNRDPLLPQLQELMDLGVFLPLRNRDKQGRLVVMIRTAVHNPRRHLQSDVFKVGKMIVDLVLEDDETVPLLGIVAVFDLAGVTLGHALQLTPSVIKKAVHTWQDCYPLSTKSLDFVNAPFHVNIVLNVFRRFMTEKLRKRVHIHRRGPQHVISTDILPEEYGGTDGKLQDLIDFWKQRVEANRDWFLSDENYKAIIT